MITWFFIDGVIPYDIRPEPLLFHDIVVVDRDYGCLLYTSRHILFLLILPYEFYFTEH